MALPDLTPQQRAQALEKATRAREDEGAFFTGSPASSRCKYCGSIDE